MAKMTNQQTIKATVKAYIMKEFLPGQDPDELGDTTPLIRSGILNSISTVKLVAYLEERFGIEFQAKEMQTLDTLAQITRIVASKLSGS